MFILRCISYDENRLFLGCDCTGRVAFDLPIFTSSNASEESERAGNRFQMNQENIFPCFLSWARMIGMEGQQFTSEGTAIQNLLLASHFQHHSMVLNNGLSCTGTAMRLEFICIFYPLPLHWWCEAKKGKFTVDKIVRFTTLIQVDPGLPAGSGLREPTTAKISLLVKTLASKLVKQ